MQLNLLPEEVHVTICMEGLRTGVARTEVFRVHPSTFGETVYIGIPNNRLKGLGPWISVMWTMKKPRFKLWKSNVTSVNGTRAEAQGIFALTVHCVKLDRVSRAIIPPQTRNLVRCGKTSAPSRRGEPYWGGTRLCRGPRRKR